MTDAQSQGKAGKHKGEFSSLKYVLQELVKTRTIINYFCFRKMQLEKCWLQPLESEQPAASELQSVVREKVLKRFCIRNPRIVCCMFVFSHFSAFDFLLASFTPLLFPFILPYTSAPPSCLYVCPFLSPLLLLLTFPPNVFLLFI